MRFLILFFLLIFASCSSSKEVVTEAQIATLKNLVKSKNIDMEFLWARPTGLLNNVRGIENLMPPGSTVNSISLIGNPNFLKIYKDSIAMDLPYYGQQQLPGAYGGTNIGVKFNGKPEKIEQLYNERKNSYILKYRLKGKNESYTIILNLFSNHKTILSVNSTHRTTINYDGNWKEILLKK